MENYSQYCFKKNKPKQGKLWFENITCSQGTVVEIAINVNVVTEELICLEWRDTSPVKETACGITGPANTTQSSFVWQDKALAL